jgi:hypothetical protein
VNSYKNHEFILPHRKTSKKLSLDKIKDLIVSGGQMVGIKNGVL